MWLCCAPKLSAVRKLVNPSTIPASSGSGFAEVSIGFDRVEDLEDALPPDLHRRDPLPYEVAFLAERSFLAYRRRGGRRATPLPDFYIGAHAAVAGHQLLTRDARRYRAYFPRLALIAP